MAKRFSNEELQSIISDYQKGLKPFELSQKYNRNSSSIINKLKSLNIYRNSNYRFTQDDILFLKRHYPAGDWDAISARFDGITSYSSIIKKMSSLNIKNESSLWSEPEFQLLRENFADHTLDDLYVLFGGSRTKSAISAKIKSMHLIKRTYWSSEEECILRANYSNIPVSEVCMLLPQRSRDAIILHAEKLNLTSFDRNLWLKHEDSYIKDHWMIYSDYQIASYLNRTQKAVKSRRQYLGLYRSNPNFNNYESISKYLRGQLQDWKKKSMDACNYQCVITGSKDFQIHHLYSFNQIVQNFFANSDFELKEYKDYSNHDLLLLKDAFLKEHDKYPLGECVDTNIHVLFHSLYGQYYNTKDQWIQFKNDYKKGVYNNLMQN